MEENLEAGAERFPSIAKEPSSFTLRFVSVASIFLEFWVCQMPRIGFDMVFDTINRTVCLCLYVENLRL